MISYGAHKIGVLRAVVVSDRSLHLLFFGGSLSSLSLPVGKRLTTHTYLNSFFGDDNDSTLSRLSSIYCAVVVLLFSSIYSIGVPYVRSQPRR